MATHKELTITITPDGEVQIEVNGAKGKECLALTAELEDALGIVTDRTKKASFFQETEAAELVTVGRE